MSKEFDIGIIGDGQLGMMLTEAALEYNEDFRIAAVGDSTQSPTALAGAEIIKGGIKSERAILDLARVSKYLTIEVEHINGEAYKRADDRYGNARPAPSTLLTIADKLDQKRFLQERGIPVAPFTDDLGDEAFVAAADYENKDGKRFVIKSRRGGFDGRGNLSVASLDDPRAAAMAEKSPLYVEHMMPFDKELSVIVARNIHGAAIPYPVVETVHKDHICHTVISSDDVVSESIARKAKKIAVDAVMQFDGPGVFAVELFVVGDDVIVNEIAPRVHNSGHLTIEANHTSQFEQHIRAVTGDKLGSTRRIAPAAVMVNMLHAYDRDNLRDVERKPDTFVHLYNKEARADGSPRKIGHITLLAHDTELALERAARLQRTLYPGSV